MKQQLWCFLVILSLGWSFPDRAAAETARTGVATPHDQVLNALEKLTPNKAAQVRIGTERLTYEEGEPLEIRFQVSEACYAVLMDISTIKAVKIAIDDYRLEGGNIGFLLPNYKFPAVKLEAGRVYSTLHDFGLKLKTGGPEGYETINLFCSTEPLALFTPDFTTEKYYTISYDHDARLQVLLQHLEELQAAAWSGNSVQIRIGTPKGIMDSTGRDIIKRGALPPIASTGTTGGTDSIFSAGATDRWFPPIGATGTAGKH